MPVRNPGGRICARLIANMLQHAADRIGRNRFARWPCFLPRSTPCGVLLVTAVGDASFLTNSQFSTSLKKATIDAEKSVPQLRRVNNERRRHISRNLASLAVPKELAVLKSVSNVTPRTTMNEEIIHKLTEKADRALQASGENGTETDYWEKYGIEWNEDAWVVDVVN
jgi:hypothetical protein